jgi:hypothetical protein
MTEMGRTVHEWEYRDESPSPKPCNCAQRKRDIERAVVPQVGDLIEWGPYTGEVAEVTQDAVLVSYPVNSTIGSRRYSFDGYIVALRNSLARPGTKFTPAEARGVTP